VLRRFFTTVAALVKGVVTLLFRKVEPQRALMPGDLAPPFTLLGSDGRTYQLADYVTAGPGKPSTGSPVAVVLAWFPKAFTAG
jgi:peroxiredoxin Q/BCP